MIIRKGFFKTDKDFFTNSRYVTAGDGFDLSEYVANEGWRDEPWNILVHKQYITSKTDITDYIKDRFYFNITAFVTNNPLTNVLISQSILDFKPLLNSPLTKKNDIKLGQFPAIVGREAYLGVLPQFSKDKYSLAFDAESAERLNDYEAGTLYFRDSNFNRVGATFSRTTTATRVNRNGLIETVPANVPRIDYTDGSAKLLMEPSRTNIKTRFNDCTLWDFPTNVVRTANIGSGAIMGYSYSKAAANTVNNIHYIGTFAEKGTNGNKIWVSAVLKADGIDKIALGRCFAGISDLNSDFDLSNGTITRVGALSDAKIHHLQNGWYLCQALLDTTSLVGGFITGVQLLAPSTGALTFVGNNSDGVLINGLQVEDGVNYPTSIIPTAGSAVTRNRDDVLIGYNSTYLPTAASTVHIKFTTDQLGALSSTLEFYGGTGIFRFRDAWRDSVTTAGDLINDTNHAISNNAGTLRYFGDGSFVKQNAGAVLPTDRTFQIQSTNARSIVERIILFPTALTDSECEQLTS